MDIKFAIDIISIELGCYVQCSDLIDQSEFMYWMPSAPSFSWHHLPKREKPVLIGAPRAIKATANYILDKNWETSEFIRDNMF